MPREITPGTPDRSPNYVMPSNGKRALWTTALLGGVIALAVLLLYVVGQRRFASPGPVSAGHTAFESRCEQCHTVGKSVDDIRCERCHDPAAADRLTHPAHVLLGSGDSRKAMAAPLQACVSCHTEHRGRTAVVKAVDDRECGQCHQFSTLGAHPEFAAVRAQIQTGVGIQFGHQRHMTEVAKQAKKCEACHEPTPDRAAFQPINFDRHCASCHTKDGFITGDSEAVSPDYIVIQPPTANVRVPPNMPAELGRIVVSQMSHRDPWVLYNATRLRRMIDPTGVNVEIAALRVRASYLMQQMNGAPLSQLAAVDLDRWRTTLEHDIAALDQPASAPGRNDAAALDDIRKVVSQIGVQLTAADPTVTLDTATPTPAAPAPASAPGSAFNDRKAELLSLLDAIGQRGDKSLSDRAAALRDQVQKVQSSAVGAQPNTPALTVQLGRLDDVFGAVRATEDPDATMTASQLATLRDLASAQINGGLSPDQFEDRRRELLGVLDAVERNSGPATAGQVAVLRQRVLTLQPGVNDDLARRDLRARKARLLARVELEIELAKSNQAVTPSARGAVDRSELQNRLATTQARLADLQSTGRADTAETPAELRKANGALNNLLTPCLKCHVMDGPRLEPVAAAEPVFQRATFTHKPHVDQQSCVSCHRRTDPAAKDASTKATDLNEPNVASCQTCHAPSKARNDCATCHVYHPTSTISLLGMR